ncbi:MAG TPA: cytochrome C oxidase subunit IV family protein [Pirellulales bacterium]|nr:cytochrome C oxidase subunit IV family protein [Pirellulales bacterium]
MSHAAVHHDHAGHDDHGGVAKYVFVFFALCVLTTMSFFTYSSYWPWRDTPAVARLFMTAVSCTKAMLVILFFMHVKYEANWKYVLTIPASIMSVFLCLALVPDIGGRINGLFGYHGRYSSERNEHVGRVEKNGKVVYDANALMQNASLEVVHHGDSHSAAPHGGDLRVSPDEGQRPAPTEPAPAKEADSTEAEE